MQIRARLTLQFALIVAAILIGLLSVIYYTSSEFREHEFFDRLRLKATTSANWFLQVQEVDSALLAEIDYYKKDILPHQTITIYNDHNKIAYTNNDTIDLAISDALLQDIRKVKGLQFTQGDYECYGLYYPSSNGNVVVVAAAIDIFGKIELKNLQRNLLFGLLGGLLIVSIVGWIYAGRALKPINDIVERMKLISASNLQTRLGEGNRTDEIARLAQTFNKMLTRLENAFNLQKTFVANVSHELKNPLTAITSQLEVSLLREREKGEYQRTLESVLEDIRNLNRAAASLLDLASLNTDRVKIDLVPTRIDELLWACRERLLINHPEYQIDIEMDLPEDERNLMVLGNDYLLGIAITNLMENGCKFSADHQIQVTMSQTERNIEIGFKDHGVGISAEDLPNIFQPFYRGKNQETAAGHGIGLSLVSRIVELHQAHITVTSSREDGTLFTISIPHITF